MKRAYSQTEKIAILLISLGEEASVDLIQKLPKPEAQKILQTMSRIGRVDQETIDSIQSEFTSLLNTFTPSPSNHSDTALRIMNKAFGVEEAQKFKNSLPMQKPKCFDEAEDLDAKTLWQIIHLEHPQTIALVLAHLSPKKSGELTKLMNTTVRTDILTRLSNIREVDPIVLEDIGESLSKSIEIAKQKSIYRVGGPRRTAEILAQLDPNSRKNFLENLKQNSPEIANEINSKLFTFEDLIKLDSKGMALLLSKVAPQELELALRKCDQNILQHILASVSDRRAQIIKENLASSKPVPLSKINEAQSKITKIALELIETGIILDPQSEAV